MDIKNIKSPDFLKKMTISELENLAENIRKYIIENVSHTGGHLSASLGAVDIIIALHYVFDSPHDKIIFDVGHQAYAHKILTGRSDEFASLRQINGLSGFLKYSESEHDVWESGHSSTAISAASGFLEAKKRGADIGEVIAFIGDGSIQSGLALSGMNILGNSNQKAIVILNDNEMSISKNVGALSRIFNKIRIKKSYSFFKKITPRFISKMFMPIRRAMKSFVYKNQVFADFGFKYIGPVNGHDIKGLIQYLEYCKKNTSPIVLHIKTTKGKGYVFSENDTVGKWHGVGPFNVATGEQLAVHSKTYSDYAGELVLEKAKENDKLCVISSAMIYNSGFKTFQEQLPSQIIDVGIAEENAVVIASALSRNGIIPIVLLYSTFLQRAYDQINHDVARCNSHVIFLIDRCGIVGEDGDTHQGIFDIALLNHLPNVVISMPSNDVEFNDLLNLAIIAKCPFAIRYQKKPLNSITGEISGLIPYKWRILKPLSEKNILSYGPVINLIFSEETSNIGLINALFIKPLDFELIDALDNTTLYIYEEVISSNSLAQSVEHYVMSKNLNIKIISYAVNDYVPHGNANEIKKTLNLDIKQIIDEIKRG